ncbi:MAG: N-acetylglucosamine-6-phosphate deacetylase [Petrimonas mucosa]|jgi:N-acetylglucosamine-6-phosphate deacetylase|uniref:N-acetylglucosamine-6-phosphate deacetylase n=2 Tax=Petrimonas mucosa TaxID=1642646 RepID=UPI0008F413E1|nr:N-acetylglucosamine-6-phosphate deacetylase [Petrimonas mucosa]SFU50460.1 N-acetylglucosamine 6-phosphate deacetylase [Porphyromonadaceae bacterium KHP3R9]HHT29718.1 N-acetylglucosamine-6-phosphate deacetylase [Petrimonas mucosa]
MQRVIIRNGRLIFPGSIESGLILVCEQGVISEIMEERLFSLAGDDRLIDAKGNYVAPGFIDIHTHGGGGHDFMDGTVAAYLGAAETHARHGTTALLPTTLTSTFDELVNTFAVYKAAVNQNRKGARFLGLHLEGPYFAYNQRGAQDPKYLRNPEPEEYNRILAESADIVRWSLAPELPGALEFGELLASAGILPSIAHSDAIYEEVLDAFHAGFSHVTHLYSAMSSVTRRNAFRYAGVLEAAYLIEDMTVEIIADGVHLPKPLLQFVYRFKGPERTALCTDSMRGAGMPDGESILGSLEKGQRVIIEDGVAKLPDRTAFAGSVATTDRLVRTMVEVAEVPLVDAVRMMTLTPARIMHVDHRKGSIEKGKDADLVIFDDNIDVSHTIIEGDVIYGN